MRKTLIIVLLCCLYSKMYATVYYVSSLTGNDNNNGTSTSTPFKNIQKAADIVLPGDVVNVMNGTYTNSCAQCDVIKITRAGTAAAWITFQNYAGHAPKIEFNSWAGFFLGSGAAYIRITGFDIQGNNANVTLPNALNQPQSCANPGGSPTPIYNGTGIAADGRNTTNKPHHLRFDNNTVHDCGGGGISGIQSDYITIEDNLIYNNCWYTIYGNSGISFWQLWNFDGTTTTHNFIRRNRCFGNRLYVPWIGQCAITDGNGIIIDDSRNTQNGSNLGVYTARTLIENNILWNNGGSGIHTYESDHVTILHNTAYQNSQSTEINNGEIFANSSSDIKIMNNILWAAAGNLINSNYNNTGITYDYNLHWGGTTAALVGANTVVANPSLVLPELTLNADFHLLTGSPAINEGDNANSNASDFDGVARPYAFFVDIGAYEKTGALPVEYLDGLYASVVDRGIELHWSTGVERGTDHFEIQRSADGIEFDKIGAIVASGHSNQRKNYTFLDKMPLSGIQYYRLNQVDQDGQSAFSAVVVGQWKPVLVRVYPNPVTDQFVIEKDIEWSNAILYNALGQVVRTYTFPEDTRLEGLSAGRYYLQVFGDSYMESVVLVKLH